MSFAVPTAQFFLGVCLVSILTACGGGETSAQANGTAATVEEDNLAPATSPTNVNGDQPTTFDARPRVVVLTDVNNLGGDPDDKQSLTHLLWYADELNIRGVVPDYWSGGGYAAAMESFAAYKQDYWSFGLGSKGYPEPSQLESRITADERSAVDMIIREATAQADPLYVLIWGGMQTLQQALYKNPDIASKIRVMTIASGRKYGDWNNCNVSNWNNRGRDAIFADSRFQNMWWLENNWTYNGMFDGERPVQMLDSLSAYGAMGNYLKTAVAPYSWAQYFRAGDTPTVLFLIDPEGRRDDPTRLSWAGLFTKPFPGKRPNYYTDASSGINWNYDDPCFTWGEMERMYQFNGSTVGWRRESMYASMLQKLNRIYGR